MIGQGSLPVSRRADVSQRCQRPGRPRRAVRCRSTCSIPATATAAVCVWAEGTHRCYSSRCGPARPRVRCGTPAAVATPVHWWGVPGSPALSAHRRDRCRCHHRPPGRPQRAHSLPADSARYPDPGRAAMLTNPGDPRTGGAARRGPGPGPTGGEGAGVDRRSGTATGVASSRGAVDCSAAAPHGHRRVTAAARRPGTAAPV